MAASPHTGARPAGEIANLVAPDPEGNADADCPEITRNLVRDDAELHLGHTPHSTARPVRVDS